MYIRRPVANRKLFPQFIVACFTWSLLFLALKSNGQERLFTDDSRQIACVQQNTEPLFGRRIVIFPQAAPPVWAPPTTMSAAALQSRLSGWLLFNFFAYIFSLSDMLLCHFKQSFPGRNRVSPQLMRLLKISMMVIAFSAFLCWLEWPAVVA